MQLFYGGVAYTPAPVKTQPIVVPPNPIAPTVPAIGSPSVPGESAGAPTGIHAITSTIIHPVISVGGIQETPIYSGVSSPIVGTSEGAAVPLSVSGITSPIPSVGLIAPGLATIPSVPTDNLSYILIAAVALFLYFMFRNEGA